MNYSNIISSYILSSKNIRHGYKMMMYLDDTKKLHSMADKRLFFLLKKEQ